MIDRYFTLLVRFSVALYMRARGLRSARGRLASPPTFLCIGVDQGYGLSPPLVLTICTHDLYSNIENRTPHTPDLLLRKSLSKTQK